MKEIIYFIYYQILNSKKPISTSLNTIFDIADDLVKSTFFVIAKTDGLRRLVIIINHLMFSVSENFEVEYIDCINSDRHLVFDCEFDKFKRKKIRKCGNYSDLQNFRKNEINNENKNFMPNDGIINTDGAATYTLQNIIPFDSHWVEDIRIYKIKTRNTYHQHKKLNLVIINDTPFNKRIIYYQLVKEKKKIPFIIEFDMDKGVFVKEREDKWTSNSLNTFNSVVLVLGMVEIFINGNTSEKLRGKELKKKKSDIKNRITIYPNTIQNIKLKDSFNMATYFFVFAFNDFNYSDVEILFLWIISLFNSDIDSPCIKCRQCNLRYVHKECDTIMFVNIEKNQFNGTL
ncbi:hypothetical protein H8356DRAFT_1422915 [Neocallimastix lanati (nom. inval.)]|nr:hypothetical protein H8356DRAFT_1422915 [Neocallimastix sp. JGI-2020a]